MKRYQLFSSGVILLLATALAVSLWFPMPLLERLELALYDLRAALVPRTAGEPIVLVSIDQESANRLGSWPWPRSYFAQAITQLQEQQAALIGLTVLYAERDPNPGLREIRDIIRKIETDPTLLKPGQISALYPALHDAERKVIQQAILSSSINALRKVVLPLLKDAEKRIDVDSSLAAAIEKSGKVVLPLAFILEGEQKALLKPFRKELLRNSRSAGGEAIFVKAESISAPLAAHAERAIGLGHLNALRDSDGNVRSDLPFVEFQGRLYPSFGLQMALQVKKLDLNSVKIGADALVIGSKKLPLYRQNRILLPPRGSGAFRVVSFADLIEGKIPTGHLKDKVVLIGHRHNMPFDMLPAQPAGFVPSIDLIAGMIENVVQGVPITRPPWAPVAETIVLVISALVLVLLRGEKPRKVCIGLAGIAMIWVTAAASLFLVQSFWIRLAEPLVLLAAGSVLLAGRVLGGAASYAKPANAEMFETTSFRVTAGGKSDVGMVRDRNEDTFCIDRQIGLLMVADGVGGRESGEVASRMATDLVVEFLKKGPPPTDVLDHLKDADGADEFTIALAEAFVAANARVYEAAQTNPQLKSMGTTLTAVLVEGARARIAHIGDSRAYLVRQGIIEQLTDDHTVAAAQGGGGDAQQFRNVLTRAVGIFPEAVPDSDELSLLDGDIFVLCSDGLTTMVPDSEILAAVQGTNDPFAASAQLVQLANRNGGKDNITVLVAYINKR